MPWALAQSSRQLVPALRSTLPAFELPALDGSRVSLDAHGGDVVLVHFFATWCEPCREEFASLAQLAASGRAITIVTINVAEVPARVRRFVEAERIALPILLDGDRAVTRGWGVTVLPTTYVLDRTLAPRLFVEGDLDWIRPDVLASLDGLLYPTAANPQPHSSLNSSGGKQ